jgi:hypothetical protein
MRSGKLGIKVGAMQQRRRQGIAPGVFAASISRGQMT